MDGATLVDIEHANQSASLAARQPAQASFGLNAAGGGLFRVGVTRCPAAIIEQQHGNAATAVDRCHEGILPAFIALARITHIRRPDCTSVGWRKPGSGHEIHRLLMRHAKTAQRIDRRIEFRADDGGEIAGNRQTIRHGAHLTARWNGRISVKSVCCAAIYGGGAREYCCCSTRLTHFIGCFMRHLRAFKSCATLACADRLPQARQNQLIQHALKT